MMVPRSRTSPQPLSHDQLVGALRRACVEPPAPAVEERHLAAIAAECAAQSRSSEGSAAARGRSPGAPRPRWLADRAGGLLARLRVPRLAFRLAGVLAAIAGTAAVLGAAGVGLPDAARAALQGVGEALDGDEGGERREERGPPAGVPAAPNPATRCADEWREDPRRFAERYGRDGEPTRDAFGRCVSARARSQGEGPSSERRARDRGARSREPRGARGRGKARRMGAIARGRPAAARRPHSPGQSSRGRAVARTARSGYSTVPGDGPATASRTRSDYAESGRPSFAGPPSGEPTDAGVAARGAPSGGGPPAAR